MKHLVKRDALSTLVAHKWTEKELLTVIKRRITDYERQLRYARTLTTRRLVALVTRYECWCELKAELLAYSSLLDVNAALKVVAEKCYVTLPKWMDDITVDYQVISYMVPVF